MSNFHVRSPRPASGAAVLCLLLAGCVHGPVFESGSRLPVGPAAPVQVTSQRILPRDRGPRSLRDLRPAVDPPRSVRGQSVACCDDGEHPPCGDRFPSSADGVLADHTSAATSDALRTVPPLSAPETRTCSSEGWLQRVEARYGSAAYRRCLKGLDRERAWAFLTEADRTVNDRALAPTPWSQRRRRGLAALGWVADRPAFHEAAHIAPTARESAEFRAELERIAASIRDDDPPRVPVVATLAAARKHLKVDPTIVLAEFAVAALESVDPYSTFVPTEAPAEDEAGIGIEGGAGIGVEIRPSARGARIERVLPGSPADLAGLRTGDVIVRADGSSLAGVGLDVAAARITGPAGSSVEVDVEVEQGTFGPITARLVRRRFVAPSVVQAELVDREAGIGIVRIARFTNTTETELDSALAELNRRGLRSLILDLRENPGGLLPAAVGTADRFLAEGRIVSTRGRSDFDQGDERATTAETWSLPLVVLVDEQSASASEIVAAAIQDHRRGAIVGRTTFGKGTVQTHFPATTVSGRLKLTTARFYSPRGTTIAGRGVIPDHLVRREPEAETSPGRVATATDADVERAVSLLRGASPTTAAPPLPESRPQRTPSSLSASGS